MKFTFNMVALWLSWARCMLVLKLYYRYSPFKEAELIVSNILSIGSVVFLVTYYCYFGWFIFVHNSKVAFFLYEWGWNPLPNCVQHTLNYLKFVYRVLTTKKWVFDISFLLKWLKLYLWYLYTGPKSCVGYYLAY